MPQPGALPRIRGTQVGLRDPALVDQIKADMIAGRYVYTEERGRVYGLQDARGTFYVKEGHHRMAAALENFRETGDPTPVYEPLRSGKFEVANYTPNDGRPMPARGWCGFL